MGGTYLLAVSIAIFDHSRVSMVLTSYLAFYLANLPAFYLANILALYLAYLVAFYLAYLLAFYLAYLLAFYLTFYLAFYLAYLLAFYLTCYLAFYLAYLLASSGILSGRWGPVVLTELGRSQAEVQRCSLSSEGPRLRSSSAHCMRKLAKSWQGGSGHGSGCKGGGGEAGGEGGGGEGGGGWGGGGGGGEQLWLNLTTLTWQVGKKRIERQPWAILSLGQSFRNPEEAENRPAPAVQAEVPRFFFSRWRRWSWVISRETQQYTIIWLVVWNMNFIFLILGMSWSQLTKSIIFQRGRLNHQPDNKLLPFGDGLYHPMMMFISKGLSYVEHWPDN